MKLLRFSRITFGTVGKRNFQTIVSTSWLADQIAASNKNVKIVQASWSDCEDFKYGHIPTAVCFDGKSCQDKESLYKNYFPSADQFENYVSKNLGVSNDSHVVVYDDSVKLPSLDLGARVWFTFKLFGHDKVSVLNGGYEKWSRENRLIETGLPKVEKTTFVAKFRPEMLATFEDVLENVKSKTAQLIDARIPGRYFGIGLEPFGKAGRIPDSVNIPVADLIDEDTKLIHDEKELDKVFKRNKINFNKPIITYCGAGIHANAPILAAFLLGKTNIRLFTGSWNEWNQRASDDLIIK